MEHDPAEARRLFSFEALERAYRECRRRKRGTRNALRFEDDLEENLLELAEDLASGRYRPRRSVCFVTLQPKPREIIAADFRDRIVHHLIVEFLEPIWERVFIHDSFASRKGKGTHAAVERLGTFIPKVTANHTKHAWYAHLDVRSFFPSIDHARSAPTPSSAGRRTFDELDQYIKHELKVRFYLRYVDDLVLLSTSREDLLAWRAAIDAFLRRRLHLELNAERSRIAPLSSGIDFLGYINHPHHRLVRRRVVGNLRSRLSDLQKRLTREERASSWILYREGESEYLRDMVASYRAHFLRARIRSRFPWLRRALPGTGKKPFWFAPRAFPCLGAQVHWFEDRYPESLIAFQVGRFWEFYGAWAARVAEAAHLKLYRGA